MSKSSNKLKVECLTVYLKTLKVQPKVVKSEFKVNIKGFK